MIMQTKMSKKNKIVMYIHCRNCLKKIDFGSGTGFGDEKLAVGWTNKGLQIWCDGCDQNVAALDFRGQKISYDD